MGIVLMSRFIPDSVQFSAHDHVLGMDHPGNPRHQPINHRGANNAGFYRWIVVAQDRPTNDLTVSHGHEAVTEHLTMNRFQVAVQTVTRDITSEINVVVVFIQSLDNGWIIVLNSFTHD